MLFCLIVDDEKWIRNGLVNRVNEQADFSAVSTAHNGQEALEWLQGNYADILITDVRMPNMDGLELVRRINGQFPWMRSILISSYDDFEYAKRGILLGTIDYIVKPIKQSDLEQALQAAAGQLRSIRTNEARSLMLKNYNSAGILLARWQEYPGNQQALSLPLLVIDTFHLLESWVGGRVELLLALADEWIAGVVAVRKTEGVFEWMAEEHDRSPVPILDDRRLYFRLVGVYRLELAIAWFNSHDGMAGINSGRRSIVDVKRYIERNYPHKLSLQQIADAVNISKPYLANVFRQETGMTIWNYLTEVRMREAKELLLTTDKRLSDVAEAVGYSDSAHFAKVFKSYYGMNSTELKNRFSRCGAEP